MQISNKTYMKNLLVLLAGLSALTTIISCGQGQSTLEQKKAAIEKLKSEQATIEDKIKTLELEIATMGDSAKADDSKSKFIAVTPLMPQIFEHSIDVQGNVDGDENVTLTAKMAGSINRVYVKAGDAVKQGQTLAEIEHEIIDAQIEGLKTNLRLATELFNKQKNLWEQKVGTEIQYLQAKTNKEALEQQMNSLIETEKMYRVIAPIAGTVDEVYIKTGQTVAPGVPAIRVVNFGKLKVVADISESYASAVKSGDEALLFFPDINKKVKSTVSYTAKVIHPMSRTFGIEIYLPSENVYRPNMVTQIKIIDYKKSNAMVVPVNTIQKVDGKEVVYVAVKNGLKTIAQKREVVVGSMYHDKAEILSGLTEGDLLITTGFQDLTENQSIKF